MKTTDLLKGIESFDWDKGNVEKNWINHRVSISECEEVFTNEPLIIERAKSYTAEERQAAFGKTDEGRLLAVVFTIRSNKIRVISARDMSRKERRCYEQEI